MAQQGYDLQVTRYDERGWRATFHTTGMEHSPTSATGSASEPTPRRAVQGAARDALRKGEPGWPSITATLRRRPADALGWRCDADGKGTVPFPWAVGMRVMGLRQARRRVVPQNRKYERGSPHLTCERGWGRAPTAGGGEWAAGR